MSDFPPGRAERTAVVVMAKPPVSGRSKTRLCPPLTHQQAADLQSAFLQDTFRLIAGLVEVDGIVFHPKVSQEAAALLRSLMPLEFTLVEQRSSGLGEGLLEAVARACAVGFGRVLLIDSDSPTLPAEYLQEGIDLLGNRDLVLGPCGDGGYYAIGMRHPNPPLFHGISWSTEWVVAQTLTAARALGLRTALLPIWYDIDTPEELQRLMQELSSSPDRAPETSACLERIGVSPTVLPRTETPFLR